MQLGSYLGLARRWWLTFALAVIFGAVAGWLASSAVPLTYHTESRVLVGPVNANFDTLRASSELTQTYGDLATSERILGDAAKAAGVVRTPDQLAAAVHATPNTQARTIVIGVDLATAQESAKLANAVADTLAAFTAGGTTRPEGEIQVIDRATASVPPVAPRTALIVVLAAVGALLGTLLIVSLLEFLDRTIRDVDQLGRIAGRAILDVVPVVDSGDGRPDRAATTRDPSYRRLLADVLARGQSPVRSILVVSTDRAAHADQVVVALAEAAADVGVAASVVDSGSHEPADAAMADRTATQPPGRVIHDGTVRHPQIARELRDRLLETDDLVVIDGGSSIDSFAAPIWAHAADAIVLVVTIGRAQRDVVEHALERLGTVAPGPVWIVAAKVRHTRRGRGAARLPALLAPPEPTPRGSWDAAFDEAAANDAMASADEMPEAHESPADEDAIAGNGRIYEVDGWAAADDRTEVDDEETSPRSRQWRARKRRRTRDAIAGTEPEHG